MFRKIELWILLLIVLFFFIITIFFGFLVRQELIGTTKLGVFSKYSLFISELPLNLKKIIKQKGLAADETYKNRKTTIYNKDIFSNYYLLLSRYDGDKKRSVLELIDLIEFKKIYSWNFNFKEYLNQVDETKKQFKNFRRNKPLEKFRVINPLMLRDGSIIFQDESPLFKVDQCGKLLWINQDYKFHHSIEQDTDGNIWTNARIFPFEVPEFFVGKKYGNFLDDGIVKISPNGQTLYKKSISNILIKNGFINSLFANGVAEFNIDPIHSNDIQPVLFNSKYWKKGDVFVSIRHQSVIFLFRPSTNEIVWLRQGPFSNQHDIEILNEKQISFFNNNTFYTINGNLVKNSNEILIYDFEKDIFIKKFDKELRALNVSTVTQGRAKITKEGMLFIEETDKGRLLGFSNSGKISWEYINKANNGKIYLLNWSRLISKKNLFKDFDKLDNKKTCQ